LALHGVGRTRIDGVWEMRAEMKEETGGTKQ